MNFHVAEIAETTFHVTIQTEVVTAAAQMTGEDHDAISVRATVLRSAKRAPATVRRLNNRK